MSPRPSLPSLVAALRLLVVGLHLLSGLLQVALLFRFVDGVRRRLLRQVWSRQLLFLLGVHLEPARLNAAGPVRALDGLIVSNHVSFLDIFVINALAPAAFVCKEDVARWPLIGWLCRGSETVFLARGNRSAAYRVHRQIVARLRAGERMVVFPEGTTSTGDRVLPFHGALFQSAIDAGVPVVCLALSYHDRRGWPTEAAAYTGDLSLLRCLWQIAAAGGLRADLQVLPPLTGLAGRRHLAQHAQLRISQALTRQRLLPG